MVIKINRRKAVKIALLALAVVVSPFAAGKAVEYAPHAMALMSAAAKLTYSANPVINSGQLILYVPEKMPGTEQPEQTAPPQTAPAVTEPPVTEPPLPTAEELLLTENLSDVREDLTVFSAASGNVANDTYQNYNGTDFITLDSGGQVWNCTELTPEQIISESVIKPDFEIETYTTAPQVLIMHTHTHESYQIDSRSYYDESYTCRSADPTQSVVAVGSAIAQSLAENGICVLHDGTVHDDTYNGAYARSAETVRKILAEYPSIRVVLDIHRDAVEEPDGTRVALVSEIDGKQAAQVMIISAADNGTYDMPLYLENFHFACALQNQLESDYSGLARPVLFQYCQYNQHLSTGSLLIEVGSHGNTLEQAVYSGKLIGECLARLLGGYAEE